MYEALPVPGPAANVPGERSGGSVTARRDDGSLGAPTDSEELRGGGEQRQRRRAKRTDSFSHKMHGFTWKYCKSVDGLLVKPKETGYWGAGTSRAAAQLPKWTAQIEEEPHKTQLECEHFIEK